MTSVYIKNFNYSIFLSLLLLLLVIVTVSKQDAYVSNLQEFEKNLILKKILSADSLFKFDSIKGVLPKEQTKKIFRLQFVSGKFAIFTLPVIPVNTKFIESEKNPSRILLIKCTCDSNNNQIINDSIEKRKFLTYKLIVMPKESVKSDLLFSGFTLYITNTELVTEKNTLNPCCKIGNIQYYLETNVFDEKPYPKLTLNSVKKELERIKHQNNQDTLSDNDFYLNTLKDKEAFVKIPLLDTELDAKKSSNSITFISICFSLFGLNMFRRARIEFSKNKSEPFFLYEVSRDISRTIKVFSRISLLTLRFDSFFILIYHFVGFLCPILIFFLTSQPRYEGENFFIGITSIIIFIATLYSVLSYFYNYLLLFSSKIGYNVFTDLFAEEYTGNKLSRWDIDTTFQAPKWFPKLLTKLITFVHKKLL